MFIGLGNNFFERDPMLTLVLSRDYIRKYAVTSWLEKRKHVHFWICFFLPAVFGVRFSNVLLKRENNPIVILSYWLNARVQLSSPTFMGMVKIRSHLLSSTVYDNVGFRERFKLFSSTWASHTFHTTNHQKFKFSGMWLSLIR